MTIKNKIFKLIQKKNISQLKKLIIDNKNYNFNISNNNITLIEYIVNYSYYGILKILLEKNSRIDITDNDGRCLLYTPIKLNDLNTLELLLKYNQKNIGIDITNIKDKNGKYPIHYCIEFNNLSALKLLIKYNVNIQSIDNNKNNVLHLAGYNKNYEIIKFLISKYDNLNKFNDNGENILIIGIINLLKDKIIKNLVLKYDINEQYEENLISPIIFAIIEDNNSIFNLLEDINVEINNNDIKGNSILHYCVSNNNYRYFEKLFDSKFNFNTVNIFGQTLLHLILNNDDFIEFILKTDIIDTIIKQTNINLQDNKGESCFFLICKKGFISKFYVLLENKPINGFLENKEKLKPIDFIDNIEQFYELLTSSFLYFFKNKDKYIINKQLISKCKKIDNKCISYINKFIRYNNVSILSKKNIYCNNIVDNNTKFVTYIGLQLDIFFGLKFLRENYKEVNSSLELDIFSKNKDLVLFYKNNGIIKDFSYDIPNIEITWSFQKLFYDKNISLLKKNNIFILPIGIILDQGSHSNVLIFDRKKNVVIRFEPYGAQYPYGFNYNPELLDLKLEEMILKIDDSFQYIPPKMYMKNLSFQAFEIDEFEENKKIGDPGGFCSAWSLWFCENYILNNDKDIQLRKLVNKLELDIRVQNLYFRNVIRTFANKIARYRDKFLNKINLDINDWNNQSLDDTKYNKVIKFIESIKS